MTLLHSLILLIQFQHFIFFISISHFIACSCLCPAFLPPSAAISPVMSNRSLHQSALLPAPPTGLPSQASSVSAARTVSPSSTSALPAADWSLLTADHLPHIDTFIASQFGHNTKYHAHINHPAPYDTQIALSPNALPSGSISSCSSSHNLLPSPPPLPASHPTPFVASPESKTPSVVATSQYSVSKKHIFVHSPSTPAHHHHRPTPFTDVDDEDTSHQQRRSSKKSSSKSNKKTTHRDSSRHHHHDHRGHHHHSHHQADDKAVVDPGSSKKKHKTSAKKTSSWIEERVNQSEEFDFQANLERFDKVKIFAEIKVGVYFQ